MKSGFVAVAGRPNVGKSTLVNALTGAKVAIVSDKPHTTRHEIRGVYTDDEAQLVLVDLPGLAEADRHAHRADAGRVDDAVTGDVDAVLLVVNARERIGTGDRFVARRVFGLGIPVVIVLNKVDRLKAGHIATQMKTAAELGDFHALHPVSAKTGDGIGELRGDLDLAAAGRAAVLPAGDGHRHAARGAHRRARAASRRCGCTKEEVPHAVTAEVVEIDDKRVHVRLYTETESQKQILIGKGGTMVREIGRGARPHVEALLGHSVFLELQVKASPKWRRNETMLERLGL